MNDQSISRFTCEVCGGSHPTQAHPLKLESNSEQKESSPEKEPREKFLAMLEKRVQAILGNLEEQGWQKGTETIGRDERFDGLFSPEVTVLHSYPITTYKKDGWEVEKSEYNPEQGHLIFDIKYNPTIEEQKLRWYPKWLGRVEITGIEKDIQINIYLTELSDQAVGIHYTDIETAKASKYYIPTMTSHGGQLIKRADNYRSFKWDTKLIDNNLPPVN